MANYLQAIPDGSRRSGTLLDDIRFESDGLLSKTRRVLRKEPLLLAMLVAVVVGVVGGSLARFLQPSAREVELLGLLGELMIRSLKMLVLPLVAGCMVASVCALGEAGSGMGRTAAWTLGIFFATTCIAAMLGVILAATFHPGHNGDLSSQGMPTGMRHHQNTQALSTLLNANKLISSQHALHTTSGDNHNRDFQGDHSEAKSPVETFLKLLRDLVPDNIVTAATEMNMLGIIFVSVFFGVALSLLSTDEGCKHIIGGVESFNKIVIKMVTAIIFVSPAGIASLIASNICKTEDIARTMAALAAYIGVYLTGLAFLCLVLYPIIFWMCTRCSPLPVYRAFAPALVTVFATDSSIASLPVTLRCAAEHSISDPIARFVLPLGATINMNGTAFFEALTVIFIAQAHGVSLDMAQLVVIGASAVLAALSAAAIPSAGLVTMVMVMQAAHLDAYLGDIGIIFALDWLLDRCRSIPNVLGDCFTCAIVQHRCGATHHSLQIDGDSLHTGLIGSSVSNDL